METADKKKLQNQQMVNKILHPVKSAWSAD